MNLSKTVIEGILLDTASFLMLITALLYANGLLYATGSMSGYGLTNDMLSIGFRDSLFYGFAALFMSPFTSTAIWILSLLGLLPIFLIKYKQQIPVIIAYCGGLFFLLLQLAASYDTGEQSSKLEMLDIENAYNGKISAEFENVRLNLMVKKPDNTVERISGFSIDVPGDYFVLVQKNKIVAILKSDVTKVIVSLNNSSTGEVLPHPVE